MSPTPSTSYPIVEKFVAAVTHRGLREPTRLLLEATQPLAPFASQLLYVAQPTLSLLWRWHGISELAHFLEQPNAIATLIAELDQADEVAV